MTAGVLDTGAVIGEEPHAQSGELPHGGEALAGPSHGDGAGHRHPAHRRRTQSREPRGPRRRCRSGGSVLGMATTAV